MEAFDDCLLCIDELHHAASDEDNRLGNFLRGLLDRGSAHVLAMTGSYFRGDRDAILHPEDEARFEKVIYTYYQQLNGYEYLKELHIGFRFYQGKYLERIGEALDPSLKTIVHIPHVGSAEAEVHKMFAVDAIILGAWHAAGTRPKNWLRACARRPTRAEGRQPCRRRAGTRKKSWRACGVVRGRDDVDVIIALGMAKEGFDWIWCEHVLTVGYRGSLTEVVQIIGRANARRARQARSTASPISSPSLLPATKTVARAVNDMLKAISVSLLMEQVMAPVFKFRTHKNADQFDGSAAPAKKTPVTNAGEIEVVGVPAVDVAAATAIETDFPDLFADVQSDSRTVTVMINPDDHHADVIYDMVVTDVIQKRYPGFSEDQVSDAVTLFGVRSGLARAVEADPGMVQSGFAEPKQTAFGVGDDNAGETSGLGGGDRFVAGTRRFVDVRELQVDLLGGRREFDDAYELLSKGVDRRRARPPSWRGSRHARNDDAGGGRETDATHPRVHQPRRPRTRLQCRQRSRSAAGGRARLSSQAGASAPRRHGRG